MIGRYTRTRLWKLLLPLPFAIAIVAAAGLVGRNWDAVPAPANIHDGSRVAQEPETRTAEQPAVESREYDQVSRAESRNPKDDSLESSVSTPRPNHSFGPASEPVTPSPARRSTSHEVVLPASIPPPTIASAPRLVPAPSTGSGPASTPALVPAPEPKAAPKISPMQTTEPRRPIRIAAKVRAVRFDASYYYGRGLSARDLAEELADSWADSGINLIYYYAYNRVYGARYHTRYAGNIMEDYGRQDLLRHVLMECHKRNIKVIAWMQGVQHKQIWESHPAWRQKKADGSDYKPDADSYFLCVRNPEVMQWWLGLVDELLQSYPNLDGIDFAEFQLDLWGDHACYCEHCREQFAQAHPKANIASDTWREFRAQGLTRLLLASSRLAHGYAKEVHVTTVLTARRDGKLMSSAQVRDAIGFDLEAVLSGPDRPDVLQAELIWQQWAATYGDRNTFTPEWTTSAVRQVKQMLRGRAQLIAHVELTDFGTGGLDGPRLARTIASATEAGPFGVDIYDAHLLSQTEGVEQYLQVAWLGR